MNNRLRSALAEGVYFLRYALGITLLTLLIICVVKGAILLFLTNSPLWCLVTAIVLFVGVSCYVYYHNTDED